MKKIISFIIAIMLLVSTFAVSAVAFAEGETTTTPRTTPVTVNTETGKGNEYLMGKVDNTKYLEDVNDFAGWLTTSADVKEVFKDINFAVEGDEGFTKASDYDTVRIEYCTGDPYYDKNWTTEKSGQTLKVGKGGVKLDLTMVGYVAFRYAVDFKYSVPEDPTAAELKYVEKEETVYTDYFIVYVRDTHAPVVSKTDAMTKKEESGLTVGTAYSIPTPTIKDNSSYTTTYVVKKFIDGEWKEVYSSVDGVLNDYEGKDIASGKITPTADDVSSEAVYKIIYTVKDAKLLVGNEITHELKVVAKATTDSGDEKPVDVLKIILYVVAGLSAVGIVLLLVIKPKKQETNTRVVYTESKTDDTNDQE